MVAFGEVRTVSTRSPRLRGYSGIGAPTDSHQHGGCALSGLMQGCATVGHLLEPVALGRGQDERWRMVFSMRAAPTQLSGDVTTVDGEGDAYDETGSRAAQP